MTKAKNVWRVSCVMTDLLTRAPLAMTASNLKGILLAAAENHSGLAVSKLSARLIGTRQPRHRRAKQRKKR